MMYLPLVFLIGLVSTQIISIEATGFKNYRKFNNEPVPVPDYVNVPSAECDYCKTTIDELDMKWTNETTVAEILADLEKQCKTLPLKKRGICDSLVQILVQIPPGIFNGIDDLAWPVSLGVCATMGQCRVNCCVKNAPPEQVHLSLASTDRSVMAVSWVTLVGEQSYVRYGTDPKNLATVNEGSILGCDKAGWNGVIHRALMTKLEPGTTYYYQVGADDASGWSEVFSFTTYKPNQDINIAVIADMAFDVNSDDTVASLKKLVDEKKIDLVIHSGDISYADGYMPHFDDFLNKVQPIASRVPYMTTPGNHEFGYNFTVYKSRFYMPGVAGLQGEGSGDGMYYEWSYGPMHFAAMNSESPIDTALFTAQEMDWVNKKLAAIDRSVTPWSIAHFHRPIYCARDSDCGKVLIQQGGEEALYNNKVDLVLVGHIHSYERTFPVYNSTNTPGAPVYIMQGASGNREGNDGNYPPLSELPSYIASAHNDIGFGVMTMSADGKSLKWAYYNSKSNEMLDSMVMTK